MNQKGEYNIPFGRHTKPPRFWDEKTLHAFSAALKPAVLSEGDFSGLRPKIAEGDFVYFDPPYLPVSKTANFTSYTTGAFGIAEQEQLFAMFQEADQRGALVMLSNSVAPEILEMYDGYTIERVQVMRYINAKVSGRRGAEEIIVRNY